MSEYIKKLILENNTKELICERNRINIIINEIKELLRVKLSNKEKLKKQIEDNESLVIYINDNLK